ncbi:MAG: SNF2-related protein [Lutibacter sp.]|uniref:helicase-related protein n=1 Tax=Lutibacter sp. TaxID=1925666 RepID=UPI00299D3D64|nr:helicase-related protein [Lutibacter sp.]MDX1828233.1 SNF2-related protein [Lutibacter sp.]
MSKIDQTDLTFFTNEEGHSLLSRFESTLKDTQLFDILVGYFRLSGFHRMYESLEPLEKIRILVGLNVDKDSYDIIAHNEELGVIDFESHKRTKKIYQKNLKKEIEDANDTEDKLELGIKKFIEFLNTECQDPEIDKAYHGNGKKLEIRAYPSKNIHAKVYIGKFKPDDRDYGFVITGSSNFSESGLVANREFNVELRTKRDVLFAEDQFNKLWAESVDISEDFIDTIETKTWLSENITPYQLYLKLIYEYLEEDINLEDEFDPFLPDGFMKLKYQSQAAIQAKKILDRYNGVFLADVVGLGKTFITALLLQQLLGRTLVICPPVLKDYWRDSLFDFGIRSFEVESLGKLPHILKKGTDRYDYIVVDEAHRFRNEGTQAYADLLEICTNKKVILVSATPLNNTINDIFAQLKLFQSPKNSTIPGVPNLEKHFAGLRTRLNKVDKADPEYKKLIKEISDDIRNNVLRYVMVRRTRNDVMTYFKNDMQKQGLVFPTLNDPNKIVYQYEGKLEEIFKATIQQLVQFTYARYTPLLFYKGNKQLSEFEKQQQRNVGGFMKGILVKRLESSFYAFRMSISRFIQSYENFIDMYKSGTIYISKKVNVYDLLENDDIEKLEELVNEDKAHKYKSEDFTENFLNQLNKDLLILEYIKEIWETVYDDPKLKKFINELKSDKILKKNKLVIFTESKETGDYLYEALLNEFPNQVMFFSSVGGRHTNTTLLSNQNVSRDIIQCNYDPNRKKKDQVNDIRFLITTDVLAEGINLHRSNVLVNYDLPWNPTRVLQRAGRVNRLGSAFDFVYIYNFFPTTHSDAHLGLEINITNKIQMFHDILGEDAKYLSDGEEFGSQELFNTLNNKKAYSGEDEVGDSELKYLEIIREIRDNDPDLFERIKTLPKKARSGFKNSQLEVQKMITFFRIGKLKKFYQFQSGKSNEATFFDAVHKLECEPETPREKVPTNFFNMLETNRAKFTLDTTLKEEVTGNRGRSNAKYIEDRVIKDKLFKNFKGFTETDEEFIAAVKATLKEGKMAKKTAQIVKKELEKVIEPLHVLQILRKYGRIQMDINNQNNIKFQKREVILSGYITKN